MDIGVVIDNIQGALQTSGVYRSTAFVLAGVNEALKLTSYLGLYDERRVSGSTTGTRNITSLPDAADGAKMISPIYVANSATGNRVNPIRILDFEFSSDYWEGVIDDAASDVYMVLSPVHELECELVCSPMQNTGTMQYDMVGVFVPVDVADGDEISFPEQYGELLYYYGLFYCFIGMPGMVEEAVEAYTNYIQLLNQLSQDMASRFPSDQGIKPVPVEFSKDTLNRSNMKDKVTQGA